MAELNSEYAEMAAMFRQLQALEAGSVGYRRQREVIIQRCLPLAHHIARRYGGRGEPHDDLVQAACVGLVNAVNRFDLDGADSMSFAVPTMMGEVRKHFRDYGLGGQSASPYERPSGAVEKCTCRTFPAVGPRAERRRSRAAPGRRP